MGTGFVNTVMNKTEIDEVVARRVRRAPEEVEETTNAFLEAIVAALKLGEEVRLLSFGRFSLGWVHSHTLIDPHTKVPREPMKTRRTWFTPSRCLKDALRKEVSWDGVSDVPAPKRPPGVFLLHESQLHAALWEMADPVEHRLQVDMRTLAKHFGVAHVTVKRAMAAARGSGRVLRLPAPGSLVARYVIADPATWCADDPTTHAKRVRQPQWS
jgi:nucleoid DNA-binding protein